MMSTSRFILFDLDNTLYPRSCGLFDHIDRLINRFLEEVVNIPVDEVDLRRRSYLDAHGTTLNGLIIHHKIDPHDYLDFVHDVPLGDYLKPDAKLKTMLSELPEKKYIFSNASNEHCQKVLDYLGLQDSFIAIYDINYFDFRPKPEIAVYRELLEDIEAQAKDGVMIDDMAVNLMPAEALGMATILFDPPTANSSQLPPGGQRLSSLMDLPQMLEAVSKD
ncbi:MAG: pyrimidine 5'-nucleotidase [Deltaproteobacteria bacterium]|nr:pyrimidine 5'-nucleotidase [Deltaproteobacteria bacterium]